MIGGVQFWYVDFGYGGGVYDVGVCWNVDWDVVYGQVDDDIGFDCRCVYVVVGDDEVFYFVVFFWGLLCLWNLLGKCVSVDIIGKGVKFFSV